MKTSTKCPKCDGIGYIEAFGHYAKGICFGCNGVGTIQVDTAKLQSTYSEDVQKKANWIIASQPADYAKLAYAKLAKIRDFAHCGFGMQQAFPGLIQAWRENGECAFQAKQEEKLSQCG